MNTASIMIEKGRVTIRPVAGEIWLTQHEIADIFDVFISAIMAFKEKGVTGGQFFARYFFHDLQNERGEKVTKSRIKFYLVKLKSSSNCLKNRPA
jgi:hypothetical protein